VTTVAWDLQELMLESGLFWEFYADMHSTLVLFLSAVFITAAEDVPKSTASPSISGGELEAIVEKLKISDLRDELRAARRIDDQGRTLLRDRAQLRGYIDEVSLECEQFRSIPGVKDLLGKWEVLRPELEEAMSKPNPKQQEEALRNFLKRHAIKVEVFSQTMALNSREQLLEKANKKLALKEKAIGDHVRAGGTSKSKRRSLPVGGGAMERLTAIVQEDQAGDSESSSKDASEDELVGSEGEDLLRQLRLTLSQPRRAEPPPSASDAGTKAPVENP
jgi:hypothetical protein